MHITESFGSGVLTVMSQWVNALAEYGVGSIVVHGRRPETPAAYREMFASGTTFVEVRMARQITPARDLATLIELCRIMRTYRADILHLHSSKAGLLGRIAARVVPTRRVLYSPHGFSFLRTDISQRSQRTYRAFETFGARLGGSIVACSSGEYSAARNLTENVTLLRNAVDLTEIAGVLASFQQVDDRHLLTIASSGRISAQRGPDLFREVAERLSEQMPGRFRVVWIGDGDDRNIFDCTAVEITGWLARQDALQFLAREVDIYVHLSRWEGLPMSVLEAMALRKPVVATDVVGNIDAVKDQETGFLVSNQDQAVAALLMLAADPSRRQSMGNSGRERAERHFSTSVQKSHLIQLYFGMTD